MGPHPRAMTSLTGPYSCAPTMGSGHRGGRDPLEFCSLTLRAAPCLPMGARAQSCGVGPHPAQALSPREGGEQAPEWNPVAGHTHRAALLQGQCPTQAQAVRKWHKARCRQVYTVISLTLFLLSYAKIKVLLLGRSGEEGSPHRLSISITLHVTHGAFPTPVQRAAHSKPTESLLLQPGLSAPSLGPPSAHFRRLPSLCSLDTTGMEMAVCPHVSLVPWGRSAEEGHQEGGAGQETCGSFLGSAPSQRAWQGEGMVALSSLSALSQC